MGNIFKRIHYAMSIIIAWIYAPFVTRVRMGSKLDKMPKKNMRLEEIYPQKTNPRVLTV